MNKICVRKEGKATLVGILIPIGSYYEEPHIKGISHFIEHCCFKGTKNRTQKEINLAIEQYGGDINAFTDNEITFYWAKIANQYKDIAIDVITDIVTNPIFPSKEIDKEREVILQELKMYEDNPSHYIYQLANEHYYPKDNGFYLPIIGTEKTLQNINKKEILNYYKKYYNNPTLIIIGDVKDELYMEEELSLDYPDYRIPTKFKRRIFENRKDISQSIMLIKADVNVSEFSGLEKEYLMDLLSEVYNDMSGRLFSKIREEYNLVYRIHFGITMNSNGIINWEVNLGLNKNKINKAYDLIIKELNRPITKKELEIAVTKTIGSQALRIESLNCIAETIAYGIRANLDWNEYLFNYEKNINKYKNNLNYFLKKMNFKENIMAGIIPK